MTTSIRNRTLLKFALASTVAVVAACTAQQATTSPSPVTSSMADTAHDHNSAAGDDKGYIKGWFEGEEVELYYTKTYFCQEPPSSGAPSGCEIGADATIAPRPGPLPTIYAIAAAGGIQPALSTLACAPGSVCLNHPAMIDASRVLGPGATSIGGVPHSHIVTERAAGWFHTTNIRVRDLGMWNQIAAAKSLDKVRELQATGGGLVSADTPTNIYFFIAHWK